MREPWEWEERRIPGAVLIPLVELPARIDDLPDDRDVQCPAGWAAQPPRRRLPARAVPGP
ncbi:MAG: rhodanese-like domain-containing protein [Candidatus Dormiibacterota bacterium]